MGQKVCPFFLLENSRPFSPWGPLDFLSICLGIDSFNNIQPLHTPLPIWNQSVVPCSVLNVASSPAYRFLRKQERLSGIPVTGSFPQFVLSTVKSFCMVNKAEAGVFLEFSCLLYDPVDVGNLIPGSSAFSKPSLNI